MIHMTVNCSTVMQWSITEWWRKTLQMEQNEQNVEWMKPVKSSTSHVYNFYKVKINQTNVW